MKWAAIALIAIGLALVSQGLWIKAKAVLAQFLLERAFAESISAGVPVKPWSWADTWPVARIEVPRIGASAIVLEGGSGQALAFGPGHLQRTPQAGEKGTAVFAAHRDTHFAFLGQVRKGDEIRVTGSDGKTLSFFVTGSEVVRWDRSGIIATGSRRQIVLATCWPLDGSLRGPMRYVVRAQMAEIAPRD